MTSQRKKKPFLTMENRIFQSLKNRTFPKELTHGFGQKMSFFVYVDLVKIRIEIMLSDFPQEKKKPFRL